MNKLPNIGFHPRYQQARFQCSVPKMALGPADNGFEVAFAGRSNAGKSSALNAITSQKALARTSKTPGRTQHLVFFNLDDQHRLVDLPGYGFARVPGRLQQAWGLALTHYLESRQALQGIVILMDIRHPLTDLDQQMLEWCQSINRPVHILLTKSDKLKFGAAKNIFLKVNQQISNLDNVSLQLFSAKTGQGLAEAWDVLDNWLSVPTK